MIKLYKDGDSMGISTDCSDEDEFRQQFSKLLGDLINCGQYEGDWEFQLGFWLGNYADIICKLRGYKSDVLEKRVIIAGYHTSAPLVASIDNRRNVSREGDIGRLPEYQDDVLSEAKA